MAAGSAPQLKSSQSTREAPRRERPSGYQWGSSSQSRRTLASPQPATLRESSRAQVLSFAAASADFYPQRSTAVIATTPHLSKIVMISASPQHTLSHYARGPPHLSQRPNVPRTVVCVTCEHVPTSSDGIVYRTSRAKSHDSAISHRNHDQKRERVTPVGPEKRNHSRNPSILPHEPLRPS